MQAECHNGTVVVIESSYLGSILHDQNSTLIGSDDGPCAGPCARCDSTGVECQLVHECLTRYRIDPRGLVSASKKGKISVCINRNGGRSLVI